MSDFFSANRVADPDLAEDGVWVTGAYNGKLDILVRRAKSKKSAEVRKRIYAPFAKLRKIPDAKEEELVRRWLAEGVLLGWRAAKGSDAEPPEYSIEAALAAFEDDPDFADEVASFAIEAETFRREALEDDAKNSGDASAGS